MKKPADCPHFRPLPTNPEVCAKWDWSGFYPNREGFPKFFCRVEEKCPSMGLRLTPRADQESDSEE